MSADANDSHVVSSTYRSDDDDNNLLPNLSNSLQNVTNTSSPLLTPPDSQHLHLRQTRNMPTSASGANSNGKRPLHTISNGNDDMDEVAAMGNGKARVELQLKTHPSGYTWAKQEDEPGHSWNTKKAIDEAARAWETIQHRDLMVRNRYGDVFEVVEKEQAVLASLKQR